MNQSSFRSLIFALFLLGFLQAHSQSDSLIAPGAQLQLVSRQFSFTEGPAVDRAGNIFFTDQPNNQIWKYDTAGKLSLFLDKAGRSNGTYFDHQGNLVACADEHDQLWSIDPHGKVTVLLQSFRGAQFNGPNDLWIDEDGGVYFTDPYYQRDYWKRTKPDPLIGGQKLYYLPSGAKEPVIVDSTLEKPNGIVGIYKKFLYIADIGKGVVYRYRIADRGVLKDRQLFANETSDGMTLDDRGNLYTAGKGVTIYNPDGQKAGHIDVPEPWTANIAFGGRHRDVLFITASTAVYTVKMRVHGIE